MRKLIVCMFIVMTLGFAKENFSQMSNQKLKKIIGFVDEKDMADYQKELKIRLGKMNTHEKAQYEKRLVETPERKIIEDEE